MTVSSSGCPECGGTGARGCGAGWHDGKPDAPSPLDEPSELIDVAASHSRWLRHNGYVQPADCMDRLCELLVLVMGRLTGEPTAAPTRPTREQVRETVRWTARVHSASEELLDDIEDAFVALLAGEGTAQPDPVREAAQALLTVDQEFTDALPPIEARSRVGEVAARRWDAMRALIAVLGQDSEHPDGLRCPRCGSTSVICHGRPHGHECFSCGYDGTGATDA